MRVRMGWSGETGSNTWQKLDVELEQDDLLRIFRENDLPDGLHERLPTKVCYQLLQNEAEALLLTKLKTLGYPVDAANARIAVAIGSSAEIVSTIKKKLALA
jgi:hypothetical protein